ncbi:O-antigen ligase family protein [Rhodobacteraceae bacterium M385]|nr:O-antigen ligase family protein [Rhodobacteraceae bacterium M385]
MNAITVGLSPFWPSLGNYGHGLFAILFMASLVSVTRLRTTLALDGRLLVTGAAILQYPLVMAALLVVNAPPEGVTANDHAADLSFWLIAFAVMVLIAASALTMKDVTGSVDRLVPTAAALAFAYLTVDFLTELHGEQCRVAGLSSMVFVPALFASVFALMSFSSWSVASRFGQGLRLGLVAMSIAISFGYTGSRFIALGQMVIFLFLAITLWRRSRAHGLLSAISVLGAVFVGLAWAVMANGLNSCGNAERLVSALEALSHFMGFSAQTGADAVPPTLDASVSVRVALLQAGLDAAREALWFGNGMWAEENAAAPFNHTHVHNQYLSWTIWGGIVALVSGTLFVLAPLVAGRNHNAGLRVDTIRLAIVLPMPLAILGDTFLRSDDILPIYVFVSLLLAKMLSETTQQANLLRGERDASDQGAPIGLRLDKTGAYGAGRNSSSQVET